MFKERLLSVVNSIKANTIFSETGFVKDLKSQGGFLGVTDEYINYFYAVVESEDGEADPYTFEYSDNNKLIVNFNFRLVFSMVKDVEVFDVLMMNKINKTSGVRVLGLDDITESVYLRETGQQLKNDNFVLYSFSCEYSKETSLRNLINCTDSANQIFC